MTLKTLKYVHYISDTRKDKNGASLGNIFAVLHTESPKCPLSARSFAWYHLENLTHCVLDFVNPRQHLNVVAPVVLSTRGLFGENRRPSEGCMIF